MDITEDADKQVRADDGTGEATHIKHNPSGSTHSITNATRIDMTTKCTQPTNHIQTRHRAGVTEHNTKIIELTASSDEEADSCVKPKEKEEHQESNGWQARNITHLEATTQRAHAIYTKEGYKTLQFPRGMQGTTAINTVTEGGS